MSGTSSDDVYFWGAGDGNDTVVESNAANNANPWQKVDTLSLVGLNPGDLTLNIVENNSRDLIITDKATGETLTVVGQFSSASNDGSNSWAGAGAGIELLQFANGTIWNPQQILDNSAYIGTPGATTLSNLDLGDGTIPIQITPGVQTVYGRQHVDNTYIWSPGDGSDTIYYGGYGGVDTLRLSNVAESDIQLIRSGSTLTVSDTATGENITIPFIFPDQTTDGIGQIVFDDGTVWNSAYINANAEIYGGTGNNTIYGPSDPVVYNMLAAGNDYVDGGGAGDTFLDGPQSGNDTFYESGVAGDINTIRLTGVSPSDVRLERSGDNLIVERLDSGKTILVNYQFSSGLPNFGVEQIVFDDGTVWNRAYIVAKQEIYGTPGDDTLDGVGAPETFDGLGGNDTYVDHTGVSDTFIYASSYGNDVIDYQVSNSSEVGTLDLTDIDPSGVTLTKSGNHLYISIAATGKTIEDLNHFASPLDGIDQISFADGTVWNRATIDANAQPPLTGNPGDYLLNRGTGQVTVFASTVTGTIRVPSGVTASDIILQADNAGNLTVALRDSGDSVTLIGDLNHNWWGVSSDVQTVTFADGSTMTLGMTGYQQGQPFTFTWIGTSANTTLTGSNYGNNVFDLGPGGDAVTFGNTNNGGGGINTLMFDKGDGRVAVNLNGVSGNAQMAADIADNDVIFQADNSGDLTIVLRDDASDSITVAGDLHSNWWGVSSALQQIVFADGTALTVAMTGYQQGQPPTFTWIGSASDTTLVGSDYGTNVFDLGTGGDTVTFGNTSDGGTGNNTVAFDKGDGRVQINLNGASGTVQMAADIADNDVIFQADNNGDLTIALRDDASDSITVALDLHQNWWGVSSSVQQILFADGTALAVAMTGYQQGQLPTFTWIGTASDTTLVGSNFGTNVFDPGSGGDTVTFGNTNNGGTGNNTLVFDKGDGEVQVSVNSGVGTVQMASDITESDVYLQADSAGDLMIMLRDSTSDGITIASDLKQNWWGTSSQVTQIAFVDGSTLNIGQPSYNTNPPPTFTWIGSGASEALTGNGFGNNTFEDGGGNDVLNGGGGYDTYKFGSSFGQTVINNYASDHDGSSYGEIDFASGGVAADQLWLQQSGNNLKIDLLGTNDSITVDNWFASDKRNQVESIHSGDGLTIDSQLQQLVSAMATYTANNPGFDPTQTSQMPTNSSLQSALAAAWHH